VAVREDEVVNLNLKLGSRNITEAVTPKAKKSAVIKSDSSKKI
jgi:hypothetical protein